MYKLSSKYDKEIHIAIEQFKEKYDKLLQEGEYEKKALILTIAECLKKNFDEMGTFELMKNNIASLVISIIGTSNVVSISSEWIIRVLKPLGYTNIYARHKNIEQVKDENKAVRELNSSIIFTNNVTKDLSVYKTDIKDTISKLKESEFKHFDDQELIKVKDQIVGIYTVLNGHINSRQESITDKLKNEPDNKPFNDPNQTQEQEDEEEEEDEVYEEEEEDINLEGEIQKESQETEEEYKKIDKPKDKPKFENKIPNLVNRIFEGYKLVAKYMKKYHTVVSNYPEFDKEFHDKYCHALEAHAEFIEGMAEYIKPHTNLKFRRDGIGWVEIAEVADKYTEGAACSRSGVPAKYYDDSGNLKEDKRRLTKEHITENMPTAKKLKKVIEKTNQYWMALNQYYLRNIQPWTVGYTKKSHDRLSNSA
jgi:hypothetical protein